MTSNMYAQHSRTLPYPSSSSSSSSSTAPATTTSMIDGTWEISVYMDGLDLRRLRVRGDLHVGGLMLKIVEGFEHDRDWSDYAVWWPKKNKWLTRMRSTLDQYDIQAGTLLHFLPVHSYLYVQLPDLQIIQMRVDFSADLFSVVIQMCRELGIRHPEELSLSLPLVKDDLKKDHGLARVARSKSHYDVMNSDLNGRTISRDSLSSSASSHFNRSSNQSLPPSSAFLRGSFYGNRNSGRFSLRRRRKSVSMLTRTISTPLSPAFVNGTLSRNTFDANSTSVLTRGSTGSLYPLSGQHDLVNSPRVSAREAFEILPRPKNLCERARCNAGWLDSSKSLMEQSVLPSSLILLKFKFYSFYDLNPLHDAVRINQLYEQAKWSILTEELDCTREEMVAFAALQLHIHQLQNPGSPGHHDSTLTSTLKDNDYDLCRTPEDIIDAALTDLQMSLEGSALNFPMPFSTRARPGPGGRSISQECSSGYGYPTIRRSANSNGMPTTNSAYSISSSSTSPFYPSYSSRYDFNGVFGTGPPSDRMMPSLIQDITKVPELRGCLRFYRPKRFFLKSYKKQPFLFKDLTLCMFRTINDQKPIWSLDLKGCEVTSEVLLSGRKYIIKLMVPLSRGADEIWFKMDDEEQYVNWLAGMRLACRGRTMADVPAFHEESMNIRDKMSMLRGGKNDRRGNDGNRSLVDNVNNGIAPNNGYDYLGPKDSPTSDVQSSTFARRDSRRRSFLNMFKRESSESDFTDGVRIDDTILRSKVKGRNGQLVKNGFGGASRSNGNRGELEEESFRNGGTRSASSTESVASIPKSLRGSKGCLYGNMAPQDFLAPRFCRRSKLKQMLHRISKTVEEMSDATDLESKLAFIKAWQSLPDYGYSYFIIRAKGSKKEDILVLTPVKIVLLEGSNHEVLKRWKYQDLQSWSVNWEVKQVMIEFEEGDMIFQCHSSDCKVIHEFIGGYIFLSMRSPEHNHKLDRELFHRLTGGWT